MSGEPEKQRQLISIVFSFRNEVAVIGELVARIRTVFGQLGCDYELIFVDDSSNDGSRELLESLARDDRRIKAVTMTRPFGVFECQMAGFAYASGDAVMYMDTDLEDPPEEIPAMIEKWRAGADVVYTVRRSRTDQGQLRIWATLLGYRLINSMSEVDIPINAGDFKLMSRAVVDEVVRLHEHNPYTRGLISWVGFRQVPHYYDRKPRQVGQSHFKLFQLRGPTTSLGALIGAITSFSSVPLYLTAAIGLVATAASLAAFAILILLALAGVVAGGFVWLAALIVFGWGTLMGALGVLGFYVARVTRDVRGRPRYVVRSTIGIMAVPGSAQPEKTAQA